MSLSAQVDLAGPALIDVISEVLVEAAQSMGRVYTGLDIQPVVGDFTTHIAFPEGRDRT